jgi:carbon-monoxide dehydrogenase catalytic subunit
LFDGLEQQGLGKWGFSADPYEMARMMIAHIDKKRKALGIDKARDRVLMDMSDRRDIDAA